MFSFQDKRTTWLTGIWLFLFALAIALLVGLLVPWKELKKINFAAPIIPIIPINCTSFTTSETSLSSSLSQLSFKSYTSHMRHTSRLLSARTTLSTPSVTRLCAVALNISSVVQWSLSSLATPSSSSLSTIAYVLETNLTTNLSTSVYVNGGTAWRTSEGLSQLNVSASEGMINFQFALNRAAYLSYAVVPYSALSSSIIAKVANDSYSFIETSSSIQVVSSRRLLRKDKTSETMSRKIARHLLSSSSEVTLAASDVSYESLSALASGTGNKIADLGATLLETAVSCGTVYYGEKNTNYTISLPVLGLKTTTMSQECSHMYNLTSSDSSTYPLPTTSFEVDRCLRCPFILPNATYVLFMSGGNKHRNTGVKHARFHVVV